MMQSETVNMESLECGLRRRRNRTNSVYRRGSATITVAERLIIPLIQDIDNDDRLEEGETKEESLEKSKKIHMVDLVLKIKLDRELAIIIAAIWGRTRSDLHSYLDISASTVVIVGFAVNIYMAANKQRFEGEKMAQDPSFERRLKHFISHIEADLASDRETLALRISQLGKKEVLQCISDIRTEKKLRACSRVSYKIHQACNTAEHVIRGDLEGISSLWIKRRWIASYSNKKLYAFYTFRSQSERDFNSYSGDPTKKYPTDKNISADWYELWHLMNMEARDVTHPYHFRVIGDLMRVITRSLGNRKLDSSSVELLHRYRKY
ncbi:hypothetical protein JCM33374_g6477 [Metschnikowia sp. JCM 33374]|nr:hypothetical protein JCM33374_g6477 [Metschnikowia sp. JCM 33374]